MELDNLLKQSLKLKSEVIKIRRQIHSYPELGFQEVKTAKLIAKELKRAGLEVKEKVARTGVVALLKGRKKGKTVVIRSDMDALPIQERTKKKYASKVPGVMHACGHDGKMAIVLGVASLLGKIREELKGQVKFIFQPNEESSGGAQAMIAAGVLKNPKVDSVFGFDLSPFLDAGKIGIRRGIVTANVDDFEISIIGKGGHVAQRWETVDTIYITAKVVEALQFIVPQKQNPCVPVVISIGEIHGGTASNVIPDRIRLKGTIRTLDSITRRNIMGKIKKTLPAICRGYGAQCEIRFIPFYSSVVNNPKLNGIVADVGRRLLGSKKIFNFKYPFFEGEDIGYFFREVPGVIFSIGIRNRKKGIVYPLHSPFFDLDEDVLPLGVAVVAGCILEYLNSD